MVRIFTIPSQLLKIIGKKKLVEEKESRILYLPLRKYKSTYPRDSKSSRRLCSAK